MGHDPAELEAAERAAEAVRRANSFEAVAEACGNGLLAT